MDLVIHFQFTHDRWNDVNVKQLLSLIEKYVTKDPDVNRSGKPVVSIHILRFSN
jgi:hypothetical protein